MMILNTRVQTQVLYQSIRANKLRFRIKILDIKEAVYQNETLENAAR